MTRKRKSDKNHSSMSETAQQNDIEALQNQPEAAIETDAYDTTDEISELNRQLEEMKDKYIRLFAEFENYKRRTVREKADWFKTAAEDTMAALLPALDDFDRARRFAEENNNEGWSDGIELLYQKLYTTLKNKGLESMESTGQVFDPEVHDAITEIPAPSEDMIGKVVDTVEKGYRLNDKIIRHAKVVVGK